MISENNNRQELIALLQNHCNLRTGQDQVLWGIFGSFWSANSLLLVSIFAADSSWEKAKVVLIIAFVVVIVASIWAFIQNRALRRITIYENSIKIIEKELGLIPEICTFYNPEEPKTIKKKINARGGMKVFSYLCIALWAITFLFSLIVLDH